MVILSDERASLGFRMFWGIHRLLPRGIRRWIRREYIGRCAGEGLRGNPQHLSRLDEGAEKWNHWRQDEREKGERGERPDLKGFNLRGRVLEDYDLREADLQEAVLRHARLRGNTRMRGALLLRADLRGADMRGAWLDDKETDLRGADLRGCDLSEALLDGADLRSVRGIILDSSRVRNARFSPSAHDPWSSLRRSYTGPRLIFNLVLLFVFLLPYAAKTCAWVAVNEFEERLDNGIGWIVGRTGSVGEKDGSRIEAVFDAATEYAKRHTPSTENGWRRYYVWELLVGLDREITYWATAIALLVYNLGRGLLTFYVAPLRDEEERSGHSPAFRTEGYLRFRDAYAWMIWPHRLVRGLFAFAVVAFLLHLKSWLMLPVLLPPQ